MPFGLTNAPRTFTNTIEQHYADLIKIISILQKTNMKISLKKSKFFIL